MSRKGFLYLAWALPCMVFAQQKDTIAERYSKIVSADLLKSHLSILASDAYEGRETGRKGQKMAAQYIQQEFKNLHLVPGNDSSFLQSYPLIVQRAANIDFSADDSRFVFKKDYYTLPSPEFKDQVFEASEVIFLGFGIRDSEMSYNDYLKTPDLRGKVVMIYPGEPKDMKGVFLKSGTTEESKWTKDGVQKMKLLEQAGVRMILFISAKDPAAVMKSPRSGGGDRMKIPAETKGKAEILVFHISKEMGDKIMHRELEEVMKSRVGKKTVKALKQKCNLKIDIHRDETGYSGDNVIGILEGSSKKNEYVFITAHYDHLGVVNGQIYNGADDDGSGTVTVLSLAKAFAKAKQEGHGPERSIVFMTVSGEEKGLLGSGWYVEHPTIPLKEIECDLNIDMIGRVDTIHSAAKNYVYVIGSDKLSSELHAISEKANAAYTQLKLDYTYNDVNDPNRFYYRSDHYNFAKNNIPVIFYFNGTHADYHQPTDKIEKIDFALMEKRARLVYYTAWDLANRSGRISVDSKKK